MLACTSECGRRLPYCWCANIGSAISVKSYIVVLFYLLAYVSTTHVIVHRKIQYDRFAQTRSRSFQHITIHIYASVISRQHHCFFDERLLNILASRTLLSEKSWAIKILVRSSRRFHKALHRLFVPVCWQR
jgi:hypothetical protein